jgi:hypothetical protein
MVGHQHQFPFCVRTPRRPLECTGRLFLPELPAAAPVGTPPRGISGVFDLARLCARNAWPGRRAAGELWRMAKEYQAEASETHLKCGTNHRWFRDIDLKRVDDSGQAQITYTRAAIRTTPAVSIRISSSSNPGIKRTLRMGTLNQVPDTKGYIAAGTEAKMWIWNLDA